MDDVLREFITESNENLVRLEQSLVELERAPGDTALLHRIFRTVHTIKGTCGFLGLDRLEHIAHAGENVLVLVRDRKLEASRALMTSMLVWVDVIRSILDDVERTGREPIGDDSVLIAMLEAWINSERTPTTATSHTSSSPNGNSRSPATDSLDATVRVNVRALDRVMDLIGEIALSCDQLVPGSSANGDTAYNAPFNRLSCLIASLQDAATRMRMEPIGTAWARLPRMVRDLSCEMGKCIELELSGADTELDRAILQALQDPLTHMVRNSADHGIELPAARRALGKPETGRIRVEAYQENGQVIIDVSDDGAGLDSARIRAKAVERGMLPREAAAALDEAHALQLIFEPGFSTAEQVTNVSGRGVGMDVVRENIERLGGAVELSSRTGVGTTVRVRIPLTS